MFKNIFDLSNKHIIITGANGILGQTIARALLDFGAKLSLVDIHFSESFTSELNASYPNNVTYYILDLTDRKKVIEFSQDAEKTFGAVDVLFSHAATKGKSVDRFFDKYEDFSSDVWREIMASNLDSMFYMTQAIGTKMAQRGKGSIILTGSIYGIYAPDQRIYEGSSFNNRSINTPAVYSASKGGVISLAKYLAAYWGEKNVRVNALIPGGISSGQNEEFIKRYSQRVPLQRMGEKRELVGMFVYLASDASSYVTGQALIIDGGLSCW